LAQSGSFVVFAQASFIHLEVTPQIASLFKGVKQGIAGSGADFIAPAAQIFAQSAAIDRPHAGLVQDDEFHHPLPE